MARTHFSCPLSSSTTDLLLSCIGVQPCRSCWGDTRVQLSMTDNTDVTGWNFGTDTRDDFDDWSLIVDDVSHEFGIQNSNMVSLQPQRKTSPLAAPQYRHDLS